MGEKKEMEKKEGKKKEGEEKKEAGDIVAHKDGDAGADAGNDGDHDDAGQDKQLIMDMLKKHGALGEAMNEDAMQMAQEMYQAYKEMGYEDNEAQKCAAHSMKLAKHMQGKQSAGDNNPPVDDKQNSMAQNEDEGSAGLDKGTLKYSEKEGSASNAPEGLEYKEANKKIIELTAQVAKLTEANRKVEIMNHLEKILKESKLSKKVTDGFREAIGTPKSVEQIDRDFKVYLTAYKSAQGSETEVTGNSFLALEKFSESAAPMKSGGGFSDCKTE